MGCLSEGSGPDDVSSRHRRNSHGTQSDEGSRFVERILTVVETCRQQQRPVFDFLRDALLAYRTGQPAPSLLPTH